MSDSPKRTLCIVVPCYNEAVNLPTLVQSVTPVLESLDISWHWLFVDDGSCDATAVVLAQLRANDARVR